MTFVELSAALDGLARHRLAKIVARDQVSGVVEQFRRPRPQKSARAMDDRLARAPAAKSEWNCSRRHGFKDGHAEVLLARRIVSGEIAVAGGVPVESRPAIQLAKVGLGKSEMKMYVRRGRPSAQSLRVGPVAGLAADDADE